MAINRKHQTAAVRFGPVLLVLFLCFAIGGTGVGYVWQKKSIEKLALQRKRCERKLDMLQKRNQEHRSNYERHTSPVELEIKVEELRLGLIKPEPGQVRVLFEPMPNIPETIKVRTPNSNKEKFNESSETMIAVQTLNNNNYIP